MYAAIMAADCGGRSGWCTPNGSGTMLPGGLSGLELLRVTAGGGLPIAGPDDSRESLDGQRGLIGSL